MRESLPVVIASAIMGLRTRISTSGQPRIGFRAMNISLTTADGALGRRARHSHSPRVLQYVSRLGTPKAPYNLRAGSDTIV